MNKKTEAEIIYSESFAEINAPHLTDWGIHLLCLAGEGRFVYNGKQICIHRNDAAVISHPELVGHIESGDGLRVEFVAAPFAFLYNLLPANHYGVSGGISLFDDPVIPLSAEDVARPHDGVSATDRTTHIVRRLLSLFEAGRCKHHCEVAYYAEQLNVTPKYLSETVKRNTGRSVSYLIGRHTVPMIADYLKNSDLSLTQICEEMHFSSLSYFSRYVQKHLGMSPSEYRAVHSPVKKRLNL